MQATDPGNPPKTVSPYERSLIVAIGNQMLSGGFASILLDGGNVLEVWMFCMLAFWVGVILMKYHRPLNPTFADLLLIRWGFIPLHVVAYIAAMTVWHWRGLL